MKFKENDIAIEEVPSVGTVVEVQIEKQEEPCNEETSIDVTELTKLLSEVIVTASDLIAKLNKVNGK